MRTCIVKLDDLRLAIVLAPWNVGANGAFFTPLSWQAPIHLDQITPIDCKGEPFTTLKIPELLDVGKVA